MRFSTRHLSHILGVIVPGKSSTKFYRVKRLVILFLFLNTYHILGAFDTLVVDRPIVITDLKDYSSLFVDSGGDLDIQQVTELLPAFEDRYENIQQHQYPEAFWLHIPIKALISQEVRLVVPGDSLTDFVSDPIDFLDLFAVNEKGEVLRIERSGFLQARSEKSLKLNPLITAVPITLVNGELTNIYIRLQGVRNLQTINLKLELRDVQTRMPSIDLSNRWIVLGPWGMFLIIGLYVLVFYNFVGDKSFLYFGIFCLLYSHNLLSLEPDGGFINLIPEYPTWRYTFFSFSLFSGFFLMLFGDAFIDIKKHFNSWYRYFQCVEGLMIIVVGYYVIRSFWRPYVVYHLGFLVAILCIIPFCIRFIWSKNRPAQIFGIGILSFLGGNALSVLFELNELPWALVPVIAGQLILLFIFALGSGYRLIEIERQKASLEKIKEVDLMKTRFFTNISHEFRTPLSLILGPLRLAEESIPFSELEDPENEITVSTKHIQVMKRNTLRLQQLVDQILDLSKIDEGKLKLNIEQGEIIKFIRVRVTEFSDIAKNKNIHFLATYSNDIAEAKFDRDKLTKIIDNVLSNALKFTPAGGQISTNARANEKHLSLSVSNSGPGLSQEEAIHIFDRFYQVDHPGQQGSGIGLALVKELVELHKGQVSVESQSKSGVTINIKIGIHHDQFLPQDFLIRKESNNTKEESNPWQLIGQTESVEEGVETEDQFLILIVEDNIEMQLFLIEILSSNFQIMVAKDGEEGKNTALKHIPDLIISDIMMPKMSGYELCEFLKNEERTSHIPIILLTAKSERIDKLAGLKRKADHFLSKPFDPKELILKVSNAVNSRELLRLKYSQKPWKLAQQKITSLDEKFLQKVLNHTQANLSNEYYSVEALSQSVGYSRSQLFRKLKALTGKGPLELIREQRLHTAKELLEKKAVTVSEAAYHVGFSNLSYFSQSFKKEFGILPNLVKSKD